MRETKSTRESAIRDELLHELAFTASNVSVEALIPVLGLLFELGRGAPRQPTVGAVRRAIGRMRLVQYYGLLRKDPDYASRSNRWIKKWVVSRSQLISPNIRCSLRTLESWIDAHNRIGDRGLSAGWSAMIDHYSVKKQPPSNAV